MFGNDRPVHIEIGMGKGKFLLTLAEKNPDINYIGIEKFSSVLVRAVEKDNVMTEYEKKFSEKGSPICRLTACR